MTKINELLAERRLPPLVLNGDEESRRKEYIRILSEHIYGYTPDFKSEVRVIEKTEEPEASEEISEEIDLSEEAEEKEEEALRL